ncbi:MAG TPA: SAM-dependent methyltransferase [Aquabacterium sp.]|jgi:predicted nicotinamide N-methyase|nr:SAM-dependent methyltransferase [Aquabacterium sp.]
MPGYEVKQESIAFQGVDDLIIRSLLDRQQYADPLGEAEALGISSATWPMFGLVWPSGVQLALHMAQRPWLANERVLEIGCGLALASMVCHRMGMDVTASDWHPLASDFLLENVRLNDMAPLAYRHGDWSAPKDALSMVHGQARVSGRFDLIMGSDVLYERDDGGLLSQFIERHAQPMAEVLIVDPNRGNRSAFNKRMSAMGFGLDDHAIHVKQVGGEDYRGRLLQYVRN